MTISVVEKAFKGLTDFFLKEKIHQTSSSKESLKELFGAFEENLAKPGVNKFVLASIDPGMGKSRAIIEFLRAWAQCGFQPSGSILVATSRVSEIRAMAEELDDIDDHFAVLVRKGAPENDEFGVGSKGRNGAPILFTTQQKINSDLAGVELFENARSFHYKGGARTLLIWDEAFQLSTDVTVNVDDLASLARPLRRDTPEYVAALNDFLREIDGSKVGASLIVPKELADITDKILNYKSPAWERLSDEQKAAKSNLDALAGRLIKLRRGHWGESLLVGATKRLPKDLPATVVTDASIRVLKTYELLASVAPVERLTITQNDYANLTVHIWQRGAGKGTLGNAQSRDPILKVVAETIQKRPAEKWLIVYPRLSKSAEGKPHEPCFLELLKARLPGVDLKGIHWGNHHGTNDFRDIENVIVLGLNFYGDAAYEARLYGAFGRVATSIPVEPKELIASEIQHSLLQAFCRSNVRRSVGGKCGKADVYLIGKFPKLPDLVERTFPGCTVHEWFPLAPADASDEARILAYLRRAFKDRPSDRVLKADIKRELGLDDFQFSRAVRKGAFEASLRADGFVKRHLYFECDPDTAVTHGGIEMGWREAA